jgi:hypothetical protein
MGTKRLIIFIVIIFITLSCSDSYFNIYPSDSLTEDPFYSTKQELAFGVNDAYYSLRTAYANYESIGDLPSDDVYNQKYNQQTDNIALNESSVVSTNGVISTIWSGAYQVISRTNIVLGKMKAVTFDTTLSKQYEGECKFLRGLMYFNLVRIFGSVPLVLTDIKTVAEDFSIGQETVDNIYIQIIQDLTDAYNLLPANYTNNADKGRATSLAAETLLGKVYLTRGRYQDAFNILQGVIASGVPQLLSNYSDVFSASNPNNAEIIFAVQYARGYSPSMGNPFQRRNFPGESIGTKPYLKTGSGEYMLTTSFVRAFNKLDKRLIYVDSLKSLMFAPRYFYFSKKYIDLGQTTVGDAGNDWMILRYADVLLMCAEAKAALNLPLDALPFITQVRTRAGLTTDNAIAATQASMNLAIENERRFEFYTEGHRWFDLLRTGRLQTVMNAYFANGAQWPAEESGWGNTPINSVSDYELLFPIPFLQVQLNPTKLIQNPGY